MWRKLIWSVLSVLVLGGAAAGGYVYYQDMQQPPRYMTAAIERGAITTTVNATGTVNAVTTVQVGTQVSGTIQKLFADFNSVVQANDIVAQIDPALFETKVAQARANLANVTAAVQVAQATVDNTRAAIETARANAESARANVEKSRVAVLDARRILVRNKELMRRALIPQNDVDTAQTTHDAAVSQLKISDAQQESAAGQLKSALAQTRLAEAQYVAALAQVEQSKAALQAAELDLQHTTIRAPVNGIVVSRNVDVGQTVAASLQAPTLFLIAQDLTQMQVDTNVSEADIGRIQVGQTATFTVDAYPTITFSGQVRQVRNAPMTVQNVVTYNAVVAVANAELRLKPGMTANVSFVIAERRDIVKVPNAALRFQPDGAAPPEASAPPSGAPQGGSGGGAARSQELLQRLTQELALTPEQQSRVSEIFQKAGQRFRALREEESEERRRTMRREIQNQSRMQIRDILTPEQRPKYEAMSQAREEAQAQARPGRVWIVGANGVPEPRPLTLGITNDTHTEVMTGDLSAGQHVITGMQAPTKAATRTTLPGFGTGPRAF
ncbi:MAG: efflux RND transporter periplasmic adaptor subunit [Candidatus Tectomicrobia bacterium]|uniref:Efflux RND transporter periplasmic adaptor subunit n=1 Tax=Tectimicrobiota bacterium TaxID=2528274 RepID=A0A937W896_UNCTE|nr:efflux RND transporter periplasmic adaptor subunit [Candidatus Tectomicrobia bacterium]